jgi:hypothetical protein
MASWCTPKTRRFLCTDDPREVTCKICQRYAQADIEEQEHDRELADRPWYAGLFRVQRDRHCHMMLSALASVVDSLVALITLGWITSSFNFAYIFWNLERQAKKAAKQAEEQPECDNTNSP